MSTRLTRSLTLLALALAACDAGVASRSQGRSPQTSDLPDEPMPTGSTPEQEEEPPLDEGVVTVLTGTPMLIPVPPAPSANRGPGIDRLRGPPVRPGEAAVNQTSGAATAVQPPSQEVIDQARALRNNSKLIYEYVHDAIEFTPLWGLRKRPEGVMADRSGTALDQANLMATLLNVSGYTAEVVVGDIRLAPAGLVQMFGTSNAQTLGQLIPSSGIALPTDGLLIDANGQLTSARFQHAWVRVTGKELGAVVYHFDPARKAMVMNPGTLNLATAMGYDRAAFLAAVGGTPGDAAGSVKALAGTALKNAMHTYTTNLINTMLTAPYKTQTLAQLLGDRTISPIAGSRPRRDLANPVAVPDAPVTVYNALNPIPDSLRPTLRLQLAGIDQTFTADALWGRRLAIRYGADLRAVLSLDGVTVATAATPGIANQPQLLTVEIDEPYAAEGGTYGDLKGPGREQRLTVAAGHTFVIMNGWGTTNRGSVENRRKRLAALKDQGSPEGSEARLAETLAMMGDLWLAERSGFRRLAAPITKSLTSPHIGVGVAGYTDAPYVDIPFSGESNTSFSNVPSDETAAFMASSGFGSSLESTVIEQTQTPSGLSTVSLFDLSNEQGTTYYDATASTWPALKAKLLTLGYDANTISNPESFVNLGYRIVIPGNGRIGKDSWYGLTFLALTDSSVAHVIGQAKGGYASAPVAPAYVAPPPPAPVYVEPRTGDPVSIVSGNFEHEEADLSVGPSSLLTFKRGYSSGQANLDGVLGRGWGHNLDLKATVLSDGFQGLGEDSAVDAAAEIASFYVVNDLLAAEAALGPVSARTLVAVSLIQHWAGQQLVDNAVTVGSSGLDGAELYVRAPNGLSGTTPVYRYLRPQGGNTVLTKPTGFQTRTKTGVVTTFNTDGTAATVIDPNGVGLTFSYSANLLRTVTHSFGWALSFNYTGTRLSSVSNGVHSVSFGYDASNNLTAFTDARNFVTKYTYVTPGKMQSIFSPATPTVADVVNTYDSAGRVSLQTNALGGLTYYFVAGTRTQEVLPLGISHVWYFDPATRLKTLQYNSANALTRFGYDGRGLLVSTRLPESNLELKTYDNRYNPTSTRSRPKLALDATGDVVTTAVFHPTWSKPLTTTDGLGQVTTYTYDPLGNLLQRIEPVVDGAAPTTTWTYNARGQVETITDQTGRLTKYVYDETGKKELLQKIVDPTGLNLVTQYTYDAVGNVASVTDPRGGLSTTTWSPTRQPLVATAPVPAAGLAAPVTTSVYDANDRLSERRRALGAQVLTQQHKYTATGKPLSTSSWVLGAVDATTPVRTRSYDAADRPLDDTDREGRVTRYEYAPNGNIAATYRAYGTPEQSREVLRTYSPNGLVLTELSASNGLTTYTYDSLDRLVRTNFPSAAVPGTSNAADYEELTYDAAGHIKTRRTRAGDVFTYSYDAAGRLRTRTGGGVADVTYTPDAAGRESTIANANGSHSVVYTYDGAGRLSTTVDTVGTWARTLGYSWDKGGNLTKLTWPEGTAVLYDYDAANRLHTVTDVNAAGGATLLMTQNYDQASQLLTTVRPGSTSTYDYHPSGQVHHVSHDVSGDLDDVTFTYGYNREEQVTSAWTSNPAYNYVPGPDATSTYAVDALDRYTSITTGATATTPTFNANGNATSVWGTAFTYDSLNRLTAEAAGARAATQEYDAKGRLMKRTFNGLVNQPLYSGSSLVAEYDGANALIKRFVPDPQRPGHTLAMMLAGGGRRMLLEDRLGNVVAFTNIPGLVVQRYAYGPFGEPRDGVCQNTLQTCMPLRYSGQKQDEFGLVSLGSRSYLPTVGRFLQPDPIGYQDDRNLYGYTHNDPVDYVDLTGTERSSSLVGLAAGISAYQALNFASTALLTAAGAPPPTFVGVVLEASLGGGTRGGGLGVTVSTSGDVTPFVSGQQGYSRGPGASIQAVFARGGQPNAGVNDVVLGSSNYGSFNGVTASSNSTGFTIGFSTKGLSGGLSFAAPYSVDSLDGFLNAVGQVTDRQFR